ncbi:putative F-box protein At1g65770 [Arachis stenosperma]|uniref:putative F-box protein At1g65770 n=1 Tax=Arachis stenosperma TaxID=217475 RepID=UPI0025ABCB6D|nr:putative F-box protein At1g65770 [Arachis stenosperma]
MSTMNEEDNKKKESVEWLALPKELWPLISKRLTTTVDLLHFRSTCSTWHSSTPSSPTSTTTTAFPLLPPPPDSNIKLTLFETKLYRIHHPSSSSSKGWIILLSHNDSFPLRIFDPFTNLPLSLSHTNPPPFVSPSHLNLLNFNLLELLQSHSLHHHTHEFQPFMPLPETHKAILFPSLTSSVDSRKVFALYNHGKLHVLKIGDHNWTILDDANCFDDMIVHNGQLYVVDKVGTISWVDSETLKLVQFSPMLCGLGKKKRLVECGGWLYVVDMYIEGEPDSPWDMYWEVVDVKVHRLDEEWGRWLDVKDLGGYAFVLGKMFTFSLLAQDYYGCEPNSLYFFSAKRASSFTLNDSKFKLPNRFWPCPSLFQRKFNL